MAGEIINIILLGDAGVGKTSWITKLGNSNIGTFTFNITEISGHQKYNNLKLPKNQHGAILMFSYDNHLTFNYLNDWKNMITEDIPIVICGNKADLDDKKIMGNEIIMSVKSEKNLYQPLIEILHKIKNIDCIKFIDTRYYDNCIKLLNAHKEYITPNIYQILLSIIENIPSNDTQAYKEIITYIQSTSDIYLSRYQMLNINIRHLNSIPEIKKLINQLRIASGMTPFS